MGNGMNKILPGLYVGNYRDSRDSIQLTKNNITHIVSIHDNAKPLHMDKKYLCIAASDSAEQNLSQYFSQCNSFIHGARCAGGAVLIHCLAGVSRSVTVTVAYLMTVTNLGWRDALAVIRTSRTCASPNFGFQRQLHEFQFDAVDKERLRLKAEFPTCTIDDQTECDRVLHGIKEAAAAEKLKDQSEAKAAESRDLSSPQQSVAMTEVKKQIVSVVEANRQAKAALAGCEESSNLFTDSGFCNVGSCINEVTTTTDGAECPRTTTECTANEVGTPAGIKENSTANSCPGTISCQTMFLALQEDLTHNQSNSRDNVTGLSNARDDLTGQLNMNEDPTGQSNLKDGLTDHSIASSALNGQLNTANNLASQSNVRGDLTVQSVTSRDLSGESNDNKQSAVTQ